MKEAADDAAVHHAAALLLTLYVAMTLTMLLAACLWCRRKAPKNELLGLEGMVKLKNPDEYVVDKVMVNSESHVDLNVSTVSNGDSEKRASTAAHRSLPDIPVGDVNGDNGSELYETVADKRTLDTPNDRNKSPTPSLKKQISVSQHSSISQADDVSSPYSRVRNPPHDYAKVRTTEHPYAQLNPPTSSAAAAAAAVVAAGNSSGSTSSNQPPLHNGTVSRLSNHSNTSQNASEPPAQAEIPAASAIAGMISASQDLPYMTPPIANQHFSGDSQDSSKGYTSISVREPLANILAQQPPKPLHHRNATLTRDVSDSHYATVSDDSDETYAAIEDPNVRNNPHAMTDIYTSGSETYAQIQPMQTNSIVVSVEINSNTTTAAANHVTNSAANDALSNNVGNSVAAHQHSAHHSHRPVSDHTTPVPPPVDSLRAQMHSRQASSSSNNSSSVCNLGSPKPEKRQANSPLPPTPKSNLTSGRSSVISVIECGGTVEGAGNAATTNANAMISNETSPQKNKTKSLSPSKDIEGMYAKVMKKNKFSRHSPSSQNNSPVMTRKHVEQTAALGVIPLDNAAADLIDAYRMPAFSNMNALGETDKGRTRSNSYGSKDHGYETIPAESMHRQNVMGNRKSDCYGSMLHKERLQEIAQLPKPPANAKPPIDLDKHYETIETGPLPNSQQRNSSDPGYETLEKPKNQSDPYVEKKSSDYDPNYEVLKGPKSAGLSDDGYAKINEKKQLTHDEDSIDGYSKVKGEENEDGATGGYSTIATDANHNYASIAETKAEMNRATTTDAEEPDHYTRIAEAPRIPTTAPNLPLNAASATPIKVSHSNDLTHTTELPITSPSSVNSASMLNSSSLVSSTNALTSSSSTMSSRQTPSTSSQYESLTGSDTDPNYESVCYVNTGHENPYERLHTEYSDTQLSSPRTPEEQRQQQQHSTSTTSTSTTNSAATTVVLKANAASMGSTANGPVKGAKVNTSTSEVNATDVVVDDYFQV